jgi:hypothetical protein
VCLINLDPRLNASSLVRRVSRVSKELTICVLYAPMCLAEATIFFAVVA